MKGIKLICAVSLSFLCACGTMPEPTAQDILGNPDYTAIAYGGYRNQDRSLAPSVEEIKEDLRILDALGIRMLRTYHARLYDHTPRLLQAISEMKEEDPKFEMYVMLGAWMQCENAWTNHPIHNKPDAEENKAEVQQAIKLANQYPDIVKIIAVGNESMVHWASGYYVHPRIILKEVVQLQEMKLNGALPADLWITSSDNFASWGGGDGSYHLPALDSLIRAVDYLSVHSYPFHDTHYNPNWWWMPEEEESLPKEDQIRSAVDRSINRVKSQVESVRAYMQSLGVDKPIHIGETGWASADNHLYGSEGSGAADEYKEMLYHREIRAFSRSQDMACFYFEAFDEPWKDGKNPGGSENHFGLITVDGEVKMPLWDVFDTGAFQDLSRGGKALRKSLGGNEELALRHSSLPPKKSDQPAIKVNAEGDVVAWATTSAEQNSPLKYLELYTISPWKESCSMEKGDDGELVIRAGDGDWFGGSLSTLGALDLSAYANGFLVLEAKGTPGATFEIGLQSGDYEAGTQRSASVTLGQNGDFELDSQSYLSIKVSMNEIAGETDLKDVRAPLYVKGLDSFQGAELRIRQARFIK